MKQTHIKLTSRKRFNKGRWMEYWHIGVAMFCLVPKSGDCKTKISTKTWVSHFSGKAPPALQRAAAVSTSCPQSISRGRDALELWLVRGWTKTDMSPRKKRISRYREGICNEVAGQNWAVRTRNLERNSEKTYIASASSTSAKRSWGPCWKFDIALGCLKLQETELYVSVSLELNPFTTQSYLDILQPLAKYEARMGDLIGNNDGSTNSLCRLQTSSGNSSFTGFHGI